MPNNTIYPIGSHDAEELERNRERREMYNPNFGLTKSVKAEIGDKGCTEKLTFLMTIQILLAIYYAVGYVLELQHFHVYYPWPEISGEENTTFFFRTSIDSFECEGYELFRIDKGPKYENIDTSPPSTSTMVAEGTWKISIIVWLILIFLFVSFCFTRLYRGFFNQLIGFITFESKHHSPPKVAKFALAFTVICNFSKGAGSVLMAEQCGYLAFGGLVISFLGDNWKENLRPSLAMDIFEIVAILLFAISFITVFFWLHIWGFCYICKRRDGFFTGSCSFWVIRIILVVVIISYYFIGIVQFDPKINFDLQYPNWAAISGISFADLVLSTTADMYYNRPCANCFKWLFTATSASSSSKEDATPTATTSMTSSGTAQYRSESDSDPNANVDSLESRLEQGFVAFDPVAESGEQFVDYQDQRREKGGEVYEKKIKHQVLMSLRSNQIMLWQAPYYDQGKRNDGALHQLATIFAESPSDVNEVLLVLRFFQKRSVCAHRAKESRDEADECSLSQRVLHKLRTHDIHLWEPPYFMDDGTRNNRSLGQLASALADCPSEVDEIMLALRVFQIRALKKHHDGSTFGYFDVATDN